MKKQGGTAYLAIRKLYGDHAEEQYKRYRQKKRITILLILLLTVFCTVLLWITQARHPKLIGGRYIERNEKQGTQKQVTVEASTQSGYNKTLQLNVMQQQYTTQELEELWELFETALKTELFAQGDGADYVSHDLNLVSSLKGYPFRVQWKSEQPLLLSSDGRIHEERLQEMDAKKKGIPVLLYATVTCQDFTRELSLPVRVYGQYLTKEEAFWKNVEEAIAEWNTRSATGEYQQLPDTVGEETLTYRERGSRDWAFLLLCGLVVTVLILRHYDEELIRQVKERDDQLEREYPQLLNRFVLYYGAGLTIKNIWQRICADYRMRKKITGTSYVYEEMLKADKNMQDGVGEKEAYSSFATAISLTKYRNLIALLQQSLQTGGQDIKMQLNDQMQDAFTQQKRTARIRGEKAGTKMLLPMFLMLTVVLVIILVPAFLSF